MKLTFCASKNIRTLFNLTGVITSLSRTKSEQLVLYQATSNVGPSKDVQLAIRRMTLDRDGKGYNYHMAVMLECMIKKWESNEHLVELRAVIGSSVERFVVYDYVAFDLQQVLYHRFHILGCSDPPSVSFTKSVAHQIFKGLEFLHSKDVQHNCLKPGSILITPEGVVKIGDLENIWLPDPYFRILEAKVREDAITIPVWNMAPEILAQFGELHLIFSKEVDIWAAACIILEMRLQRPIFQLPKGEPRSLAEVTKANVKTVFNGMTALLGSPSEADTVSLKPLFGEMTKPKNQVMRPNRLGAWCRKYLPSPRAEDLISKLMKYDPSKRITAKDAMGHPWFAEEAPAPSTNVFEELSAFERPPERTVHRFEIRSDGSLANARETDFSGMTRIEGMPSRIDKYYIWELEGVADTTLEKRRPMFYSTGEVRPIEDESDSPNKRQRVTMDRSKWIIV